jgi:hypothetical protein
MKKILLAAIGLTAIISSCKKNDLTNVDKPLTIGSTQDTLRGTISVNTTVTRTTILQGLVYVAPGVTLTVNPGVTIKGSTGPAIPDTVNLENNKGTLLIQQGAQLIANGTATSPIVWTSEQPVGSRHYGDWGGVVLYGNATMHKATGATTNTFEAFDYKPDVRNTYGGTNDADNSGSIKFNRFEFGGGVVYQVNKEVNGFTMCAVGSATVFNHNEIAWAGDDAIEFFGGDVNIDHVLAYEPHDDNFDEDEGYHGKMQFIIGYQTTNCDNSGSHFIESDNDASATNALPHTNAFIANATFVGPTVPQNFGSNPTTGFYYDGGVFVRRNSRLTLVNSLVIAQQQPFAVVTGPTTNVLVASAPSLSDSVVISYNIFQTNSANPVVKSTIEGNPTPLASTTDAFSLGRLGGAANNNVALGAFADFKLDGTLKPLAGSPALSGGANLAALGLPFFAGTTQRGAVTTTDVWTASGTWISIANN